METGKSHLDEPLSWGTSEKLIEEWLEKKPLNEWFSWGKQDKEIVLTGVFQQDGQNIRAKVTVWQASASVEVSGSLDLTRALCYRIEQMGSGVQQLVLMAGLIALSRADIIAIEEPEMNLSWPTQKKLRFIFKEMVEKRETPPSQMFISSHSPLFEFYGSFYRVEMNEGRTNVIKATNEERRLYSSLPQLVTTTRFC